MFLGFVVNFCAFYLQLFGQRVINASTASLLFGLEGVFALLIGVFYVQEIFVVTCLKKEIVEEIIGMNTGKAKHFRDYKSEIVR